MRRRDLIKVIAVSAAAWPLAARAQHSGKLPTIGFLGANTAASQRASTDAFVQRLRELGWIEGRTITIEYRWAEGRYDRSAEIIAELVRLKVDVIVTHSGQNVIAAKRVTSVVPIVFAASADPVGTGLVASLARPGGNVTGLSIESNDLAGKRLEISREIIPHLHRLAFLAAAGNPNTAVEAGELETAAGALGFEVMTSAITRADEIATAIEMLKGRADMLYCQATPLINTNRVRINTLALGAHLPAIAGFREFVESGGLMSYGPNFPDLFRRAAEFADKILRGAKPAEIPVVVGDTLGLPRLI
jgi:putative tryptophan/tyrosine transport system substrate-binding protein